MKHWSTFMVIMVTAIISGGMMIMNIDGLVYNVCTSDGPHGINSLLPQNLSYTGVSIKILKTNPTGSLSIQVSSDKKIQDIILWAEFRDDNQTEQHIGAFEPIAGHAYTEGCDGQPNSTITNYGDFTNTSQIVYEWDPPAGTKVIFTFPTHPSSDEKELDHKYKKHFPGEKKPCSKDKKKHHHKEPYHEDKKKHHKGKKKHHHKEPCPEDKKKHHHKEPCPKDKKKDHHKEKHPKSPVDSYNMFTFKGVAFLENEPGKFYVFTWDKPIYIQGNLSASSTEITPTNTEVFVNAFENANSATSNLQSGSRWNRMGVTMMSFLVAGMLIL